MSSPSLPPSSTSCLLRSASGGFKAVVLAQGPGFTQRAVGGFVDWVANRVSGSTPVPCVQTAQSGAATDAERSALSNLCEQVVGVFA